MSFRIIC